MGTLAPPEPTPSAVEVLRDGHAEWNEFVHNSADATLPHLADWREVMEGTLGHEYHALVARDRDGACTGLLPLVRVKSRLFGHYLVSMPFLNAGGAVGALSAQRALCGHAVAMAGACGADLLELRGRIPSPGLRESHRKLTVRLALQSAEMALWNSLPPKVRSQVRRPLKAGLHARIGADEREPFYEVYASHMRALGSPALGAAFFAALARHFPQHVRFAAVYRGHEPVAGGCGFAWRGEFELVWAAASRAASRDAPNMLLYWSLMNDARVRGATVFDFGRCSSGSGTHRFKQQWGGTDVALPWGQWSARERPAPPTPDDRRYGLAVKVWRRLPESVTRALGPPLARLIP
jgi:FemAB-related protein (PEP-CTERM system-associated)